MVAVFMVVLSGCGGTRWSQPPSIPTQKKFVPPVVKTESGFYENKASKIGQNFLRRVSDTVHFAYDSSALQEKSLSILNKQAAYILKNRPRRVTIEGHTDERGTREYNLALGERRADVVKKYLESRGVPADIMRVISYGKERPIVPLHTPKAWAINRRAVTLLQ